MSRPTIEQWKAAVRASPDLTDEEKRVALTLAKYATPDGRVTIIETPDDPAADFDSTEHDGGAT